MESTSTDSVSEANAVSPTDRTRVPDRLSALLQLEERPAAVRWTLLLLPFLSWWWLDGWLPQVGFSRQVFRAAIHLDTWSVSWLGTLPLLALGCRVLLDRRSGTLPQLTLLRISPWIAMAVALRLCALADLLTYLFPWLTIAWTPHLAWGLGLAILWSPPDGPTPADEATSGAYVASLPSHLSARSRALLCVHDLLLSVDDAARR